MTVSQIIDTLSLTLKTPDVDTSREITGGCVCDLLSLVMANGREGMAWITVQTHINVIAVASLHDFACVIVCDGCEVDADTLEKASAEGIPVLSTGMSGYEIAGKLYEKGIK